MTWRWEARQYLVQRDIQSFHRHFITGSGLQSIQRRLHTRDSSSPLSSTKTSRNFQILCKTSSHQGIVRMKPVPTHQVETAHYEAMPQTQAFVRVSPLILQSAGPSLTTQSNQSGRGNSSPDEPEPVKNLLEHLHAKPQRTHMATRPRLPQNLGGSPEGTLLLSYFFAVLSHTPFHLFCHKVALIFMTWLPSHSRSGSPGRVMPISSL